jgi:hypothetical protein
VEVDEVEEANEATPAPKSRRGGPRPGSGAPKGNVNALKHGRYSRRQAHLLESLLAVPDAREAFIALAKRNKKRRRQAEEGAGVLMTLLLEKVAEITLRHQDDHRVNNQEFLDFLNLATAEMRLLLRKQPRQTLASTKARRPRRRTSSTDVM